jgi:hypothetical protein
MATGANRGASVTTIATVTTRPTQDLLLTALQSFQCVVDVPVFYLLGS